MLVDAMAALGPVPVEHEGSDEATLPSLKLDALSKGATAPGGQEKQTAKRAIRILLERDPRFLEPSKTERRAIAVAFAMAGKIVYGAAFDVIRMGREIDLSDPTSIFENIDAVTLFEIKSTNKASVQTDFRGYFFDLTTAELLVAQSLGSQYRFAFVNTISGAHVELSLNELFARARKIYPKWAVSF
jgi:hypothetical protein